MPLVIESPPQGETFVVTGTTIGGIVAQYSTEEREVLAQRALELHARRLTYTAIAEELALHRVTVKRWIDAELAKSAEHRGVSDARETAIATYEAGIRDCWRRLRTVNERSTNLSALHNNIRSYQERIDKLTGAEAPIKYREVEDEIVIEWEDIDNPAFPEGVAQETT